MYKVILNTNIATGPGTINGSISKLIELPFPPMLGLRLQPYRFKIDELEFDTINKVFTAHQRTIMLSSLASVANIVKEYRAMGFLCKRYDGLGLEG